MKNARARTLRQPRRRTSVSELLILPDGQILVHNLTRTFAELLHKLNPDAAQISSRAARPPATRP